MINTTKKICFYVALLACTVFITTLIYSCSSEDDTYTDEKMHNDVHPLMESVATSDEFWEFERSSELLLEKFQAYTSTLSEDEYDKFIERLNDDDYMEEFIKTAHLEKELQQMNEAKENLILHTGFSTLSEDERMLLFRQYAESREHTGQKLLKTRTEGDSNSCEVKRKAAYAKAKADYNNAIIACRMDSSMTSCYSLALSKYERNKDMANIDYEKCIQGN